MGRKKLYHERTIAAFPTGTFKRINKVLGRDEDRTDFIREAVEMELLRRYEIVSAPSPLGHGSGQ